MDICICIKIYLKKLQDFKDYIVMKLDNVGENIRIILQILDKPILHINNGSFNNESLL